MKTGWLLYDACDYKQNHMFAEHMRQKAEPLDIDLNVVLTENIKQCIASAPDFVISRQRDYLLSRQFEEMNIPVFNASNVCRICNNKQLTHSFLQGLPVMPTRFIDTKCVLEPNDFVFPVVVKPSFGHGGNNVYLVENSLQLKKALKAIAPQTALVQKLASDAGKDLRVYVLFGNIIASVLRTAKSGIISNYKRGGNVELHTVSKEETALVQQVLQRFESNAAPLSFAGIDLIYHHGKPVVNEIEDVVGSRMLYQVSFIDCIDLYIRHIAGRVSKH